MNILFSLTEQESTLSHEFCLISCYYCIKYQPQLLLLRVKILVGNIFVCDMYRFRRAHKFYGLVAQLNFGQLYVCSFLWYVLNNYIIVLEFMQVNYELNVHVRT